MVRVDANERYCEGTTERSLAEVARAAMDFVMDDAGFAQVFTINRAGFPVGRTMVAVLNRDWTVDLVQQGVHRRLAHLVERPQMEIVWVGTPAPGSVNDRPHVYDFGLLVPRAVFVRGLARVMDEAWTLERYRAQTAIQRAKALTKAPERTDQNVRMELVGVQVKPLQVRAEGFGSGAQSYTWIADEEVGA